VAAPTSSTRARKYRTSEGSGTHAVAHASAHLLGFRGRAERPAAEKRQPLCGFRRGAERPAAENLGGSRGGNTRQRSQAEWREARSSPNGVLRGAKVPTGGGFEVIRSWYE
jgi:hypothetical protein